MSLSIKRDLEGIAPFRSAALDATKSVRVNAKYFAIISMLDSRIIGEYLSCQGALAFVPIRFV